MALGVDVGDSRLEVDTVEDIEVGVGGLLHTRNSGSWETLQSLR